jgi:hypothetical protein
VRVTPPAEPGANAWVICIFRKHRPALAVRSGGHIEMVCARCGKTLREEDL